MKNDVIEALRDAAIRGVEITIIMDRGQFESGWLDVNRLDLPGISVCLADGPSADLAGIMQLKLIIIDGREVAFGSANATRATAERHYDGMITTTIEHVVKKFRR